MFGGGLREEDFLSGLLFGLLFGKLFLGKRGGQQCVLPDAQSCAIWSVLKNFKKSKETG